MRFNIEIGYQIILGRLGDADDVVGCFSGFFKHDPIILPVEKRKILRKSQKNKIQHGDDARTGDFPGPMSPGNAYSALTILKRGCAEASK